MDANDIKINRKRCLGNTSISDFFKPKVCNTDGNNNASSSVISNHSEQGKGNDSNQWTLPSVVTTPDIQISASVSTIPVIQTSASVSTTPDIQTLEIFLSRIRSPFLFLKSPSPFLCQLTCQSADIMSSLCGVGVRVRVNNFSSKTTRPRDVLFFLKDTLSIEDEKLFKACKSVCSSVC